MAKTTHHPSLFLDFFIVALGIALVFSSSHFGLEPGHPATKGAGAVLGGFYIIYLGALFLFSYFFPGACYIFNLLTFVCEVLSHPAGRYTALVYFVLSVVLGSGLLLIGLGFL
jgi:hypothetical protein